jgi:Tyrosyl-DNA phosphodiesterase
MSRPDRKRRADDDEDNDDYESSLTTPPSVAAEVRSRRSAFLASLSRGVSPPAGRQSAPSRTLEVEMESQDRSKSEAPKFPLAIFLTEQRQPTTVAPADYRVIQSPFKLTRIRDLPENANIDTVGVKDILGDVMLKEVWLFDFLFDVDWVMYVLDNRYSHHLSHVLDISY